MSFFRIVTGDITVLIGTDSLDLLHSVTTQSVNDLSDNTCIYASILGSNGRMKDRILIWNLVDQIAIIHLDGCSDYTRELLSKSVSWKQNVQIIPLDLGFSSIWEYETSNEYNSMSIDVDGQIHTCCISNGINVHLAPNEDINHLSLKLKDSGINEIDKYGFREFQINNGLINGDVINKFGPIPLEISLTNDISFTKGCYTGQEIIARMDAREALARTLVTFSSTSHLDSGNSKITGGGRLIVYDSIDNGERCINLGLVHPDFSEPGTEFTTEDVICNIISKW